MGGGLEVFDVGFNTIDEGERFVPMPHVVLNQGFANDLGYCWIVDMTNIREYMVRDMCIESAENKMCEVTIWVKIDGCVDLMTEPRIFDHICLLIGPDVFHFLDVVTDEECEG